MIDKALTYTSMSEEAPLVIWYFDAVYQGIRFDAARMNYASGLLEFFEDRKDAEPVCAVEMELT